MTPWEVALSVVVTALLFGFEWAFLVSWSRLTAARRRIRYLERRLGLDEGED
ncbi:hypothetical protein KNU39_gp83 [Gordonia phage Mutzi]|uniref:Uncharacterized protein n=2 Tax=Wizardvirus TaxID=2169658 RepID=A0A411AXU2_9CAUD|nr:hypothetical protein KNU39_gp83 [Gordonia phage Mutzi]QAX92909.1 hypothetical protein SEA_MUTZI_83 [Gordonia phage Mutzi]QWY84769.1 hypothetical protein SEA_YUNGMONEY_83 [Gordonia phage YungMoney]WNO27950.1 membrane protein [Gordonia phage Halo3]